MNVPELPPVSPFLRNAFLVARAKYQNQHREWTNLSYLLSGRFSLPPATMSVQRNGDLDLLLRCIEDECEANKAAEFADSLGVDFTFHYQVMLSETWVVGCYEIFRSFRQRDKDRKLGPEGVSNLASFKSIIADLECLRMPLAKYEIAKDKEMNKPMVMEPFQSNNDAVQHYVYGKDNPSRYHIMPAGMSVRGSMMWLALDHKASRQYWIERRELAWISHAREKISPLVGISESDQTISGEKP
jgi:hypothetical protein